MTIIQLKSKLKALKPELHDRFGVSEIGVFGSYVRQEENSESDIDVLVEFEQGSKVTLFTLMDLEEYLTNVFAKKVDVVMKKGLKPIIGRQILREVEFI